MPITQSKSNPSSNEDILTSSGNVQNVVTKTSLFFRLLFKFNDYAFAVAGFLKILKYMVTPKSRQLTRKSKHLSNKHKGKRCFILGTSPSIGQQDLKCLENEFTIAVNFFHKHSDCEQIQPNYWVIQDKKLWNGGWPEELISEGTQYPKGMINDIYKCAPNTVMFLPYIGAKEPSIQECTQDKAVYWLGGAKTFRPGFKGSIDITGSGIQGNVMMSALSVAVHLGFEEIYLLGISLDGLICDLSGSPSHFYAAPPENTHLEYTTIERDLMMSGIGFRQWRGVAEYFQKTNIKIVNLTPDGYLSIFPRNHLENVI